MKTIKTCVFPVAGLGSRFLPATKSIPKEMMVVVDKPLIQYAVEEAKAAGIERFIFVTSQGKAAIEDHFDSSLNLELALKNKGREEDIQKLESLKLHPGQAIYIRQPAPLGLGHAVLCAKDLIDEDSFAVILADDLILSKQGCLDQMIEAYGPNEGNMVGIMNVPSSHTDRYGILDILKEDQQKVYAKDVFEKPKLGKTPSYTAIIGRYILKKDIFSYLFNQSPGAGGEIQLTDSIKAMIPQEGLCGFRFEGKRFDCGTKEGWLEANLAFAWSDPYLHTKVKAVLSQYPF